MVLAALLLLKSLADEVVHQARSSSRYGSLIGLLQQGLVLLACALQVRLLLPLPLLWRVPAAKMLFASIFNLSGDSVAHFVYLIKKIYTLCNISDCID